MMWYIVLLASVSYVLAGDCEDSISKNNRLIITLPDKNLTMTSCAKAVKKLPGICQDVGGEGQSCCESCSKIGTPDCLDKASRMQSLTANINGKVFKIGKCSKLLSKDILMPLCSPDVYGGNYHSCCQTCKDICVDSQTWKLKSKKCMDCSCGAINSVPNLMDKCCEKNWKGIGADGKKYRCREMCCDSCS